MAIVAARNNSRKAQSSIFILIGFLLIAGAAAYFLSQSQSAPLSPSQQSELGGTTSSVKLLVQSCLEQSVDDGVRVVGLKKSDTKRYLERNMPEYIRRCTGGFSDFQKRGVIVKESAISPTVTITDESIIAEIEYPLTITLGGQAATIRRFLYQKPTIAALQLQSGTIDSSETLTTPITGAKVSVSAPSAQNPQVSATGAAVVSADTSYNFYVREVDAYPGYAPNPLVLSPLLYEVKSSIPRVEFTVTIPYTNPDVPMEEASIGYSEENGVWHALPTTRDAAAKTLTAKTSHLGEVGVVRCANYYDLPRLPFAKQTFVREVQVFEQKCGRMALLVASPFALRTCSDAIGLWKKESDRLFLSPGSLRASLLQRTLDYGTAAAVIQNPEVPKGQLSFECSLKDWDSDDRESNKCVARDPEGNPLNDSPTWLSQLKERYRDDPDARCKTVCGDIVKREYGSLYGNVEDVGRGDGIKDDFPCTCTLGIGGDLRCGGEVLELATPPTYGYDKPGIQGGWGVFEFFIADQNRGCVVERPDGEPDISVRFTKSYNVPGVSGDASPIEWHLNPEPEPTLEKLSESLSAKMKSGSLRAGSNKIYFKVLCGENDMLCASNGCMALAVEVSINGVGISDIAKDVRLPEDCTIQQRLNYLLCPNYPENLEGCASSPGDKGDAAEVVALSTLREKVGADTRLSGIDGYERIKSKSATSKGEGCGVAGLITAEKQKAAEKCKPGRVGHYCNGEDERKWYRCDGTPGGLMSEGACEEGLVCDPYYPSQKCIKKEQKGCVGRPDGYEACVKTGKPEYFACYGGIRADRRCSLGACYYATYERLGVPPVSCAEDPCEVSLIEGDAFCESDGTVYQCRNNKKVETGRCSEDEECLYDIHSAIKMGSPPSGPCIKKEVDVCEGKWNNGKWYCSYPGVLNEIYTCERSRGKPLKDTCLDPAEVCINHGEADKSKLCGRSSVLDRSICKENPDALSLSGSKPNGVYCRAAGQDKTAYRCENGKVVETRSCSNVCYQDSANSFSAACSQPPECPFSQWFRYSCDKPGSRSFYYCNGYGGKKEPEICGEGKVCKGGVTDTKEEMCVTEYEQACSTNPASKVFCEEKGKSARYYYCDSAGRKLVKGSCENGKVCKNDGADNVDGACDYVGDEGCKEEGSACYANRAPGKPEYYSCTKDGKGVLRRSEGSFETLCCNAGYGQVKGDGDCSKCYDYKGNVQFPGEVACFPFGIGRDDSQECIAGGGEENALVYLNQFCENGQRCVPCTGEDCKSKQRHVDRGCVPVCDGKVFPSSPSGYYLQGTSICSPNRQYYVCTSVKDSRGNPVAGWVNTGSC